MWSIITQIHNLKRTQFNWIEPCFLDKSASKSLCFNPQLKQAGSVCRMSADECDLTDYCTGASAECPEDSFEMNGKPCYNQAEGYCHDGQCPTHEQHCWRLFGPGNPHSSDRVSRPVVQVSSPASFWNKLNLEIQALSLASLSILANKTERINFLLAGLVLSGKSGAKGNTWCCVTLEVFFCQAPLLD